MLGGEDWVEDDSKLDKVTQTAMVVNLLTEDNLPSYHATIAALYGREGAWGNWVGRWTAEEARHGIALRDYLTTTRGVDPTSLERQRMAHMSAGYDPGDKTPLQALGYVTLQELATRVSHRNTGEVSGDPIAKRLLTRIATDENLHMVFYRELVKAAFEVDPNGMMRAVTGEVKGFAMPGDTIPDFQRQAAAIAMAGIYDPRLHIDMVVRPTIRAWKIESREDLSGDGEAAREELMAFVDDLEVKAQKFETSRERLRARRAAKAEA